VRPSAEGSHLPRSLECASALGGRGSAKGVARRDRRRVRAIGGSRAAEADIEFTPRRSRHGTGPPPRTVRVARPPYATTFPKGCAAARGRERRDGVSVPSFPYGCAVCESRSIRDRRGGSPAYTSATIAAARQSDDPPRPDARRDRGLRGRRCGECVYDPATGSRSRATLMDYVVPGAESAPELTTEISEVPSTRTRSASGGGGEAVRRRRSAPSSTRSSTAGRAGVEHIEMPRPERVGAPSRGGKRADRRVSATGPMRRARTAPSAVACTGRAPRNRGRCGGPSPLRVATA